MGEHRSLYVAAAFTAGILLTLGIEHWSYWYYRKTRRTSRGSDNPFISTSSIKLVDGVTGQAVPNIIEGVEGLIGNTPLVKIRSLSEATGCEILAKAEYLNGAGGSPKDRVALSIIENVNYTLIVPADFKAERNGDLTPYSGDAIYEGTVGSTGISLAAICRSKGYLAHIIMPSDQALEKSDLLEKLGAVVERVTPAPISSPNHFVNLARRYADEHTSAENKPGKGFFANQFETAYNWQAHYEGTGPEIFDQTAGKLDAFVAGAGTGGTISGVAMFLKQRLPSLKVYLADPQGSGLYNKVKHGVMFDILEREGTRRRQQVDTIVEGIGINRVTANFDAGKHLIDDAVRIRDEQALAMAKWLVEKDGLFVGSSSAVNLVAAARVAQEIGPGKTIVTIICDSGTRHLSKFWKHAGAVGDKTDTTLQMVLEAGLSPR